ncbi:protein tyrosine phosphatase [Brucella melitensis]|uniref:Protein tyrosine phosphatase n=1 Tax=Brucella suis TaxID=29461 RepID=A0AAU8RCU3_BRUSS|nr:Low molecular weight phosphotyrosine protein phosphatase [Brucella melitensis NI]AIN83388.1 protein tyrosine phosphatase [Brucella suis]ALY31134.1 protein tyrosine phosphatase [Brucella suis 019]AOG33910.1 protein tyrosine phosphatase [Brucella canis]AOG48978.1 protein tyrosine phosphatase [Brucella melitensis]EPZ76030.1 Low molecular weight phosphotyrosine protein phosphatase [Brucella melitensis ADMAS-G1]EXU83886.1 Low molecular weight phosphotyrosine protein phosphatase [Brucella melite
MRCHLNGAFVRFFAGMVAIGSGRIDQYVADAAFFKHIPHHPFGKRRAADIAGTNEKNTSRGEAVVTD